MCYIKVNFAIHDLGACYVCLKHYLCAGYGMRVFQQVSMERRGCLVVYIRGADRQLGITTKQH